jgi:hypothetical protein
MITQHPQQGGLGIAVERGRLAVELKTGGLENALRKR